MLTYKREYLIKVGLRVYIRISNVNVFENHSGNEVSVVQYS